MTYFVQAVPMDDILRRYSNMLGAVGEGGAYKAMARALNHEGKKTCTLVKRALGKQTSIPPKIINKAVKTVQARPDRAGTPIEFAIKGRGSPISLMYFKPTQFKAGTKATVWGKRRMYAHAFMGPRPSVVSPKLKGHVYIRSSDKRYPIKLLHGPAVSEELVKDLSLQAFESSFPKIVDRVGHELGRVMKGF